MKFRREMVTVEGFRHPLNCCKCDAVIPPGSVCVEVPMRIFDGPLPVVMLGEMYANGSKDDDIYVSVCESCGQESERSAS